LLEIKKWTICLDYPNTGVQNIGEEKYTALM